MGEVVERDTYGLEADGRAITGIHPSDQCTGRSEGVDTWLGGSYGHGIGRALGVHDWRHGCLLSFARGKVLRTRSVPSLRWSLLCSCTALGLAISFVVYILSPSASTPSIPMSRTKTDKLAPAFDSSDDDFSVSGRAASAGTGTGVVDENAARRLAAAAMVEAEAEAQAFLDKQADVRREMDAVLKGKEKAA